MPRNGLIVKAICMADSGTRGKSSHIAIARVNRNATNRVWPLACSPHMYFSRHLVAVS